MRCVPLKTVGSIKIKGMKEQALTIDHQENEQEVLEKWRASVSENDWVKFVESMFEDKLAKDKPD